MKKHILFVVALGIIWGISPFFCGVFEGITGMNLRELGIYIGKLISQSNKKNVYDEAK